MPEEEMSELEVKQALFQKLETLLTDRGLEFTPPMRFLFWNDPGFYAHWVLIMELFEKIDKTSTWDPWKELDDL